MHAGSGQNRASLPHSLSEGAAFQQPLFIQGIPQKKSEGQSPWGPFVNAASLLPQGIDVSRLHYPSPDNLNEDFLCGICKKIVLNPQECSNRNCGSLFCTSCLEHQFKSGDRSCKVCNQPHQFEQPSQVILKILLSYQVLCNFCRKPFSLREIGAHEGACERSKCANELCGIALEHVPDTLTFMVAGSEKVACSRKCKKVAKFAFLLKSNAEAEVLKGFEEMLRKKSGKKSIIPSKPTLGTSLVIAGTHRPLIEPANLVGIPNWSIADQMASRPSMPNLRKTKSMMARSIEDSKEGEPVEPINPLLYGFLSEFHEFAWDPEVSSKEVQFSADYRHLFLCESNYYFRTVVSLRPFMEGVHYWEIVADSRTEHELKVGVTTQQKFNVNSSFSDYEFGYAYYGLGQLRHSSNAIGIPYGKQFKKKGILGVCLDMNKGTLAFSLDGEFMGQAFEDPRLRVGPIYAAISLLHIAGCTLISGLEKPSYFP